MRHSLLIILIAIAILAGSCGQAPNKQMVKREVTKADLPLYTQLLEAIEANDTKTFDKQITKVPDIDYFFAKDEDQYGDDVFSLLGYTCITNNPIFAEKLIKLGADIGSGCESEPYVRDNLYLAVRSNATEIAKQLLENGAGPNGYNDESRFTILSLACVNNNYEIAKLLVEHGANVNGEGDNEYTDYSHFPLVYAVQSGDIRLVQLLLDNGADIDVANREGGTRYTPLSQAQQAENKEIYNLLRSRQVTQPKPVVEPDLSLYKEVASSDGKLKLYSRDNGQGGSWVWYDNYLKFVSNGKTTSFEGPINHYIYSSEGNEDDRGTQYDKIDTIQGGGKTYYLVHTLAKAQGGNFSIGLMAYTINDRSERLEPADLFLKGQQKTNSFYREVWWADMERTYYYEKEGNAFYVPITEETGDMQISIVGYEKYKWMGDQFKYVENEAKRYWLHPSLRVFEELDAEFDTDRFHMRIDKIADGNYRYASWSKGKATTDTPNIVIQNGKSTMWDSAKKQFTFTNGEYSYICTYTHADDNGHFTGEFVLTQNGKEIQKENIKK